MQQDFAIVKNMMVTIVPNLRMIHNKEMTRPVNQIEFDFSRFKNKLISKYPTFDN